MAEAGLCLAQTVANDDYERYRSTSASGGHTEEIT